MAVGISSLPDLETQKNEISNLIKTPLRKGETWFLIDNKWFKQWKKYVGYDSWETCGIGEETSHPGPIDNTLLLKDDKSGEIKDHLIDELDYVLVPQEAWDLLSSWYGTANGQQPIARKVVEYGMFVKHCKVEVYLMEFKLCQNSDLEHCVSRKFSKADTVEHIEKEMRALFNIPDNKETRLWNRYSSNTYEHLSNKDSTVQDASLYQGQVLIIEQQNDDGTWPKHVKSTGSALSYSNTSGIGNADNRSYNNQANVIATQSYGSVSGGYSNNTYNYDYHSGGMGNVQPGLCGLSNLGNTCFMNAALQCMSNTSLLTEYFLDDRYWDELNVENPLGMKGEIARSYGEVIKTIWSGQYTYTIPRSFKMMVGRFAPQFSGYQQQDCQELMAFLLDGLHEDLNRVKKKPYVELKEAEGRRDEVVAKEAWENYQKRNNSIIVDIFHGLLKSTLVCPDCTKVSVTFDPFCYLSLPLPVKKERQIGVFLVPLDSTRRPIQVKATVPKMGSIQDLRNAVSKISGLPADKLVVTDVHNHRLHKIFQQDEGINNIQDRDEIFVYEVNVSSFSDPSTLIVPVCMREKRIKPAGSSTHNTSSHQLFGQPLLVAVPRKTCTYAMLYDAIFKKMSRFVQIPDPNVEWWIDNETDIVNGEVEMTNGDELENEHQDEQDEVEEAEMTEENTTGYQRLFSLLSVNAYGNAEVERFKNNDQPLKLGSRSYVAIDWHPKAREKFYDDREAKEYEVHESVNTKLSQKKHVIQLSECLELFTTTEKLGVDDPWYCPTCKKHQQATKKFDLWSLPRVLIIHLKRFSYNRYWRDKLDILVEFPVKGLNMAKYIINQNHGPAVYDLIAVANHYGGMGGGHYTAYGKNKDTGQWYYFDDSSVSSAIEDNIVSKAAYVLFYQRRDSNSSLQNLQHTIPAALGAPSSVSDSPSENEGLFFLQ